MKLTSMKHGGMNEENQKRMTHSALHTVLTTRQTGRVDSVMKQSVHKYCTPRVACQSRHADWIRVTDKKPHHTRI